MPPESAEAPSVSGSDPGAGEATEQKTQESTVQPESRLSTLGAAIAEELAPLREKNELDSESDSGDEPDSEVTEDEDSNEEGAEEEDESEDSDSEDEDEDSEESDSDDEDEDEDGETEGRIPKKRLDREIDKRKKAESQAEEARELVTELSERVKTLEADAAENQKLSDFIDYVIEAAEFMPDLKHFIETNPVFAGKEPTIDDFESADDYRRWVNKQAEKRANELASGKQSEAETERQTNEILDNWETEIGDLKKDPLYGKYVQGDNMAEIRSFIEEQGLSSLVSGKSRLGTIKSMVKFLFSDELAKDFEKRGAEKTIKKIDKSRKKVSLKSKGSAAKPKTKADPRKMTTMDVIRQTIEESKAI